MVQTSRIYRMRALGDVVHEDVFMGDVVHKMYLWGDVVHEGVFMASANAVFYSKTEASIP